MYKTKERSIVGAKAKMTVNTETLAAYLDCGKATAVKIGEAAGARFQINNRVLWRVDQIQQYLECQNSSETM